jgi:hypothetical protein
VFQKRGSLKTKQLMREDSFRGEFYREKFKGDKSGF